MTTRIVELRRGILKKNDELAAGLRASYAAAGVLVLNLVSSPGSGKTSLLVETLRRIGGKYPLYQAARDAGEAEAEARAPDFGPPSDSHLCSPPESCRRLAPALWGRSQRTAGQPFQ